MKFVVTFFYNPMIDNNAKVYSRVKNLSDFVEDEVWIKCHVDSSKLEQVIDLLDEEGYNYDYYEDVEEEDYSLCDIRVLRRLHDEESSSFEELTLDIPEYKYNTLGEMTLRGLIMPNLKQWAYNFYDNFQREPYLSDLDSFIQYLEQYCD